MMCIENTLHFYDYSLGIFFDWLEDRGVINLDLILTISNFPNIEVFSSLAESKPTYI